MKIAFRHIQNDCVLCHANKLKDVGPMGECLPITEKFLMGACWTSHFLLFLSLPSRCSSVRVFSSHLSLAFINMKLIGLRCSHFPALVCMVKCKDGNLYSLPEQNKYTNKKHDDKTHDFHSCRILVILQAKLLLCYLVLNLYHLIF